MWGSLRAVALFLGTQTALGQINQLRGPPVRRRLHKEVINADSVLPLADFGTALRHAEGSDAVAMRNDNNPLAPRRGRKLLLGVCVWVVVILVLTTQPAYRRVLQDTSGLPRIYLVLTFADADGLSITVDTIVNIELDGSVAPYVGIESLMFSEDGTELCEGCSLTIQAEDCISNCDNYDKDAVNEELAARGDIITYDFEVTPADTTSSTTGQAARRSLGSSTCPEPPQPCPDGSNECGEPHMLGLSGQSIDWTGVDGGWYSMVKDEEDDIHINVRLTAPLPVEFPNRQLMTGIAILSEGHSLVIEVKDPYTVATNGCSHGVSPCLADGGLRITVDGDEDYGLLGSARNHVVADGMRMSASNLPAECRQFGGDRIWAQIYNDLLQSGRQLQEQSFEDWVLKYNTMAAPEWCTKYIAEDGLEHVQSNYALFKIVTPAVVVRLHVGVGHQGDGETDWDGRVLPDLDFWQMDIGVDGLDVQHQFLSGILGETAHPVFDDEDRAVMKGPGAMRGKVEDYRVSGAQGTDFALLHETT